MSDKTNDSNFFAIDPGVGEAIGDPLATNSTIKLPFTVLEMWWKNGTGTGTPVEKFGGWGINAEIYDAWMNEYNDVPSGIGGPYEWVNGTDMSKTYSAYGVRAVWVAPILRRSMWFLKKDTDPNNPKNYKSSTEYLCYAANYDKETNTMVPMGPVVLKAKSNMGLALDDAFKKYQSFTAQGRKELAGNSPSNFFYQFLGTKGDKIVKKTVGSGQNSRDITPVQPLLPGEVTKDNLKLTFVGSTVAAIMADLKVKAQSWADDWNLRNKKNKAAEVSEPAESGFPSDNPDLPF